MSDPDQQERAIRNGRSHLENLGGESCARGAWRGVSRNGSGGLHSLSPGRAVSDPVDVDGKLVAALTRCARKPSFLNLGPVARIMSARDGFLSSLGPLFPLLGNLYFRF